MQRTRGGVADNALVSDPARNVRGWSRHLHLARIAGKYTSHYGAVVAMLVVYISAYTAQKGGEE